ncbi:alpha/beta hydrolase family protein [Ruegeria hyattellae]|uniref:alpha/beta hydrolase family protein n=1 Tax=Ruegeria hyattellae TaxID=3233337 RepID=UPI00355B7A20
MLDAQTTILTHDICFDAGPATLSGKLFLPIGDPVAAVVINSATGVPQSYYRHFARWLAESHGMAVLTYDYRDFETSRSGPLRTSRVKMSDWILIDMPAARAEVRRRFPGTSLWVIGHSLGAMAMPMQDGIEDISRMISVCSGLVHHGDHPWPYQGLARLFWFGHGPLATRLAGYLPGRLIGFGPDLPAGVYWEWRRWCTSRDSYLPDAGWTLPQPNWRRSDAPVKMVTLTDDDVCPAVASERLARLFDGRATLVPLEPSAFGLRKVGHLGVFTRANAALWPEIIA